MIPAYRPPQSSDRTACTDLRTAAPVSSFFFPVSSFQHPKEKEPEQLVPPSSLSALIFRFFGLAIMNCTKLLFDEIHESRIFRVSACFLRFQRKLVWIYFAFCGIILRIIQLVKPFLQSKFQLSASSSTLKFAGMASAYFAVSCSALSASSCFAATSISCLSTYANAFFMRKIPLTGLIRPFCI